MKIQRCNYIPEGEIKIIEDMDTLIHNLVTPELKELQQENKQLKSILTELEEWTKSEYDRYYNDKENLVFSNVEVIDFGRVLDKIQELKEKYK